MRYTDENRGQIQNKERARQLIDFRGIRYGNITPTDIDGYIEYHNKAFIFYEMKRNGCNMSHGQELSLRNIVDSLFRCGKYAVLFLCDHDVSNPHDDIIAADAIVRSIYLGNGDERPGRGKTAKEATDIFIDYVKKKTNGGSYG